MQSINYWKQFESTGKIQDYLTYSSCRSETKDRSGREGKAEESPYAGISDCDRNGLKADAHCGI